MLLKNAIAQHFKNLGGECSELTFEGVCASWPDLQLSILGGGFTIDILGFTCTLNRIHNCQPGGMWEGGFEYLNYTLNKDNTR